MHHPAAVLWHHGRGLMSWSVTKRVGLPEKLRTPVSDDFDRAAKYYKGTPEETDVLAAKQSVMDFLTAVTPGNAAVVEANGSRGAGWLTVTINCSAIKLEE